MVEGEKDMYALSRPHFYRRKAVFEAMQWQGDNADTIKAWLHDCGVQVMGDTLVILEPHNGRSVAGLHEILVRSASGRIHRCKPGTFEAVHEPALADPEGGDLAEMQAVVNAARGAADYWKAMAERLAKAAGTELPKPPVDPRVDSVERGT